MKVHVASLLLAASFTCSAAEQSFPVPGENWRVTFDAPPGLVTQEVPRPNQFYVVGTNDRFTVSLTIYSPNCEGGQTVQDNLRCLRAKVIATPGVLQQSVSVEETRDGLVLSYVMFIPNGTVAFKAVHTHVLFSRNGKWGDLHASSVRPRTEEIAYLLSLGDKFKLSE
jgi:hypothetical protein